MVVRGDDDTMPEVNNADKEKDIVPAIISILQCIKQSEDVVDPENSKVKMFLDLLPGFKWLTRATSTTHVALGGAVLG